MSYVSLGDLRQYLNQINKLTPGDAPANDSLLDAILARAQSIVDGALGFTYNGYAPAASKPIMSYGGNYLELPPYKLGSITSVKIGDTAITDYTVTNLGNLYRSSRWYDYLWTDPWGYVAVTAQWGYGDPPESINEVILEVAVSTWRGRDKGMYTETIGADGAGALRFTGGLTTLQRTIIENVKKQIPGSYGI
jgi:hypothetical protein